MKPKILIVDDRPENLLALERLLDDIGVEIIRAESGNQALAKTLNIDFALALIDVQMPDMDGFETVELLRQQEKTRYLPVIFISAIYNEEAHLIKGVETGAVDFVVKPIVPQLLIGKVKIILDLYTQKKELEDLAEERKKRGHIFKLLAKALMGSVDAQDVYESVVEICAAIFKTEHAMVGRIISNEIVETSASYINGQIVPPLSYRLKGTPCEDAASKGMCLIPDNAQTLFPQDQDLVDMGIEGYVGVSVKNSKGEAIGILNAFSSKPLQLPDFASEVLEILAGRTAAVIEQEKAKKTNILLKKRLQQAQKMEAIGTLSGGIAHDFNNILFPLMGFAEMARDSVDEDDPLHSHLDQVMDAANRAKDLVQQILTFSRQSGQEKRSFELCGVITEALKLMRATIPTTIEIQQDIDPNCGMIKADPTQIHQVVMNLCTNAYHAMRENGGTLTVSLNTTEELLDPAVAKTLGIKPGKYIKLEICDTGIGMEKSILDKIFDPYFTTKLQGEGTGLGLSVVHGIIKRDKGAITVSSEPGKGTAFQVFFPQILQRTRSPEKASEAMIPTGNEHIFFIDDEETICRMMCLMLERLNYRVTCCQSPVDALEIFKEQPDQFDMIITDMTMPEMTGVQLAKKILKLKQNIPILLCTGFSELTDHEKAKTEGITGYLMKPVSKKDLAIIIRKTLDGSTNA